MAKKKGRKWAFFERVLSPNKYCPNCKHNITVYQHHRDLIVLVIAGIIGYTFLPPKGIVGGFIAVMLAALYYAIFVRPRCPRCGYRFTLINEWRR
ncbi:MAG: hypothetical protein KJ955_07450 [Nanoarchaeota archaeon]|nr:hypothetical protein [Nanoarchaeota archaeon]